MVHGRNFSGHWIEHVDSWCKAQQRRFKNGRTFCTTSTARRACTSWTYLGPSSLLWILTLLHSWDVATWREQLCEVRRRTALEGFLDYAAQAFVEIPSENAFVSGIPQILVPSIYFWHWVFFTSSPCHLASPLWWNWSFKVYQRAAVSKCRRWFPACFPELSRPFKN